MLFCIFQSRTGRIIPTSSDLIGMRIECSKLFHHAVKKIIQTASVARSSQTKTNRTQRSIKRRVAACDHQFLIVLLQLFKNSFQRHLQLLYSNCFTCY